MVATYDVIDSAPPFAGWDFHVVLDADWNDPLPQLLDANEDPLDLTGKVLQIYVRPSFGYDDNYFDLLSSVSSAGITIDDADEGLATVHIAMATLNTRYPIGKWAWFLRMKDGTAYEEIARGAIYVHPGSDATGS